MVVLTNVSELLIPTEAYFMIVLSGKALFIFSGRKQMRKSGFATMPVSQMTSEAMVGIFIVGL